MIPLNKVYRFEWIINPNSEQLSEQNSDKQTRMILYEDTAGHWVMAKKEVPLNDYLHYNKIRCWYTRLLSV